MAVDRRTVDLSAYPDLVVIYLGMRVNAIAGLRTLLGIGPKITRSAQANPAGLLSHELMIYSIAPPHVVIRQYWQDFNALEAWARSEPHRVWWKNFLAGSKGTGFWHETYRMGGGIEAVYDDVPQPVGMLRFAPSIAAQGGMFSARQRLERTQARDISAADAAPPAGSDESRA